MTGERMYPILPCPDLDEALDFWAALGFRVTFVQRRPYPCAVVQRDDMAVHLSGIDGFDPATSVSSAVVVVPDPGALHASFAAGLRARYGRLPVSGTPRLLRPRRKQGTATGFSLVDTGGCWLRFYGSGGSGGSDTADTADAADASAPTADPTGGPADGSARGAADAPGAPGGRGSGLERVLEVAARQGDSRGDESLALQVLDRGLVRHDGGSGVVRVRALLYRAELLLRLDRPLEAAAAAAEAATAELDVAGTAAVAEERDHVTALLAEAGAG